MKVDWYLFVEHDIADATYVKWYICMNLIFQLVAITVGTVTVDVTEINAEGYNGLDGVIFALFKHDAFNTVKCFWRKKLQNKYDEQFDVVQCRTDWTQLKRSILIRIFVWEENVKEALEAFNRPICNLAAYAYWWHYSYLKHNIMIIG